MKSTFYQRKAPTARVFTTFGAVVLLVIATASTLRRASSDEYDLSVLPPTSEKKAEPTPHYPSRLALYVQRNWNLARIEPLAKAVGAAPSELIEIANELGLPEYAEPKWEPERCYITLTRRNWSLLPYDQLLILLELTPLQFAEKLREDDFLSVKLGAKPYCEPLRYSPPTEDEKKRMREIASELKRELKDADASAQVPLFSFLDEFYKEESEDDALETDDVEKSQFEICYLHSYFAVFGDPLLQDSSLLYPNALLRKLRERGINGVWLHSLLRDLTPSTDDFPEFGEKSEIRRANLRDLTTRAKKYGIDVYLYMNEPRAEPTRFFDSRPEIKGVEEGNYCAMCASSPKVRKWLEDSLAFLFTDVPELGGVFTISGSENLTTCVSHGKFETCPRCSQSNYADLIVDLNSIIERGVHRGSPNAKVIVWDWGWRGHGLATDIIERLPKNVWLQSVSEWALPLNRGGVPVSVGEYSISAVGPGSRALAHWKAAQDAGLKTIAKCQFNSTWELASVPSIPALDLVARHARLLSQAGIDGVMAGWSLGGYPSINLEVVREFAVNPNASEDEVLQSLAEKYFGKEGADEAREAWQTISESFQGYPYAGSVVYNSPHQIGSANLLRLEPTGWRATMVGIPYDDLDSWRGPYPPEVFANQMEKSATGFRRGANVLKQAALNAPVERREEALSQARYASVAANNFGSVANQVRFILARHKSNEIKDRLKDDASNAELLKELRALYAEELGYAQEEIELAKSLRLAVLEDSRIGFESTNQYWFVSNDLEEKITSCLYIAKELKERIAELDAEAARLETESSNNR